jgi:hypothetical protein
MTCQFRASRLGLIGTHLYLISCRNLHKSDALTLKLSVRRAGLDGAIEASEAANIEWHLGSDL